MPGLRGDLTIRGWCLLTAGLVAAVCAVLLDERDLLRVAAFAVALPLLAILVVGLTQVRLVATRDSGPRRTPAGSDREVQLAVSSTGLLDGRLLSRRLLCGRLLLEDAVPAVLADSVPDNCARFVVSRLPGSGTVRLSYSLHLVERGIHTLGPLVARIADPLGLAEYRCTLAGSDRLVVTPVVTTLTGMPAGGELGTGAAGAGR
ncbi:MAG: DUF58 domain-containing protein, partial [Actinomycetota bacterium]|nr:DUF58 domain-containing protein [Actinomycetota bacterium]